MKHLRKLFALVVTLCMALGLMPVLAEETAAEAAGSTAYIMFANADWSVQYWMADADGVTAENADVTGAGSYTVGLTFDNESAGVAFMALGLHDGEKNFPNYFLKINEIRVNGEAVEAKKGYTSSDDGVETRMNIYNEWVGELPEDARSYDGVVPANEDTPWIIVNPEDFAAVTSIEIDFDVLQYGIDTAYIMFASEDWSSQFWFDGNDYENVTATTAEVTGPGEYTVGLTFDNAVNGTAFTALGLSKGELTFPGMYLQINDIRINGESVEYNKGYTSSDDGVETRMNIYNEWVGELPADARSYDGEVPSNDDTPWILLDKAVFADVTSYEIDFTLVPVTDTAYIMFADDAWAVQYWLDGAEHEGVTAENAVIEGPGEYTVGLTFDAPTTGVAFAALGIKTGEKTFPGYFIDIKEIKVNGESVDFAKNYTSSDDKIETRSNLMNEWVGELPSDARRADGDLDGATWLVLDKETLTGAESLEITFDYVYGKPAAADESAPLTEEELAELLSAEYHAYVAVQSDPNYIFRNDWDDATYGRDSDPETFSHLSKTNDSGVESYGGSFEDAVIKGSGSFTASMTTGEMGFGDDTGMHFFRVSTDIPSRLVTEGHITIDCSVKIGDGKTNEGVIVQTDGEFVKLVVVDNYNSIEVDFGWMVPAPETTTVFTINVDGLTE